MESIASTAIYFASSLTTFQAPNMVPPMPTATAMVPASITRQGIEARPANAAVIVNPFTAARRRSGRSLGEAIAAEVKRDAVERPAIDGETASRDPEPDPRDESLSDESLGADVMAAHDARIGFITRRMDELRREGASATASLDRLRTKLGLAMAARRLAVARDAIGHLPAGCGSDPGSDVCGPAPIVVAANAITDHRGSGHGRPRRSSASHHKAATGIAVASTRPLPMGAGARRLADIRRDPSQRATGPSHREVAFVGPAHHPAAGRPTVRKAAGRDVADAAADASDHARRLLTTARRLLEGDDNPHPDVKLAGLLHWDGSETWSLANYSSHAA